MNNSVLYIGVVYLIAVIIFCISERTAIANTKGIYKIPLIFLLVFFFFPIQIGLWFAYFIELVQEIFKLSKFLFKFYVLRYYDNLGKLLLDLYSYELECYDDYDLIDRIKIYRVKLILKRNNCFSKS